MTDATTRKFEINDAVLTKVPLWFALTSPSGAGKTKSALRLATGMQRVSGGDIACVDTEKNRSLHYADEFKFKHIPFDAPFGSLDYLAAVTFAVKKHGVKTCIIDSMSHEHEGVGGYLLSHDAEMKRIGAGDRDKEQRATYTAWIKPSADRRRLINELISLDCNFIFCFRAKDKIKIEAGKNQPTKLGWMPIAGPDFLFEMTVSAILYPGARGVPTWETNMRGEGTMIKLPGQFESLFEEPRQLDEATGEALAKWSAGGGAPKREIDPATAKLIAAGDAAAMKGMKTLEKWFIGLSKADQKRIKPVLDATMKPKAYDADNPDKTSDEPPRDDAKDDTTTTGDAFDDAMKKLKGPPSTSLTDRLAKIASAKSPGEIEGFLKWRDDIAASLDGFEELNVFDAACARRARELEG